MSHKKHIAPRVIPPPDQEKADPPRRPDLMVDEAIAKARDTTVRCLDDVMDYTREHPQQALLSALCAGYVLRMLPTTRVLGGVVQLALPLVMPASFVYCVSKIMSDRKLGDGALPR